MSPTSTSSITFRPRITAPERVLCFGGPGVGKSSGAFDWVDKCPDVKGVFIDIDYTPSAERLLYDGYEHLEDRVHIIQVRPDDWRGIMRGVDEANEMVERGDVLSFDSATHSWQAIQDFTSNELYDEDPFEHYLSVRQEAKDTGKGFGVDDRNYWPAVNSGYFKLYSRLMSSAAHVYMTAEVAEVGKDDDEQIKNRFGPYGVKPAGQKKIGFVPHTVLLMTKTRAGEHRFTTVKDRGKNREEVEDRVWTNFATDYLVKIAGWKPTKLAVTQ